ncbi:MAG: hypothetical protein MUF07_10360 [Steroidobacteraceae bacterium]|jgi:hypothetical protein|nr:hypothetical protein [Steroidobacteraceae bacterium]
MNDLALAPDFAAPVPAAAPARAPDSPRWWHEWISQVLAATPPRAAAAPRAARHAPAGPAPAPDAILAAAGALREARRALHDLEAGGDAEPLALAVARQQLHLARRAWQERVEQLAGPGAHWCLCSLEGAASH